MQVIYGKGFIDTSKPPFKNDRKLRKCCLSCESYSGSKHNYSKCSNCPVLDLYEEYVRAYYENWHNSWADGTYQNGW